MTHIPAGSPDMGLTAQRQPQETSPFYMGFGRNIRLFGCLSALADACWVNIHALIGWPAGWMLQSQRRTRRMAARLSLRVGRHWEMSRHSRDRIQIRNGSRRSLGVGLTMAAVLCPPCAWVHPRLGDTLTRPRPARHLCLQRMQGGCRGRAVSSGTDHRGGPSSPAGATSLLMSTMTCRVSWSGLNATSTFLGKSAELIRPLVDVEARCDVLFNRAYS